MRKILIGIIGTAVALGTVLAIFLATFDINHYKTQITKGIESAIGSPVAIGEISLGWSNGVALELRELAIYRDKKTLDRPALYLERAVLSVRLLPLLGKRLEIGSIRLVRPKFNVIKEADGSIHINGINPPPPNKAKSSNHARSESASLAAAVIIGSVKVEGAEIGYYDRSPSAPLQMPIHRLDILIKNLSFSNTVDFQANMGIFNSTQNLHLEGRIRIASMTGPYVLEEFKTSLDLANIKLDQLMDAAPSLKSAGLQDKLLGRLDGTIWHLKIDGKGLSDLDADVDLTGGRIFTASLMSPLENVNFKANAKGTQLQLKNFSADFADGKVTATGASQNYMGAAPQSMVGLRVEKISLARAIPKPQAYTPQLHGNFSATFNGEANGLTWPPISKSLTGKGSISLTEGAIVNLNILKLVFDKLSQIPGVGDAVNNQLPLQYKHIFEKHDTILPPIQFPVEITDGVLMIPNLEIVLEGFELRTAGRVSLEGAVSFDATFVIDPGLSEVIAQSAPQIQYILDNDKRLVIPVKIRGNVRNLVIEPDMSFIFSKVMETKGNELISQALQKAIAKGQSSSSAAASSGDGTQEQSYQKVLSKLFQ